MTISCPTEDSFIDCSDLWKRNPIKGFSPTETGSRGSICSDKDSNIYAILPGNIDSSLTIMQALKQEGYLNFKTVWRQDGFDGEPLVDQARLDEQNVLSIFTRTDEDEEGKRRVVVIDIDLGGPEEYPYGMQLASEHDEARTQEIEQAENEELRAKSAGCAGNISDSDPAEKKRDLRSPSRNDEVGVT